VFVCICGVGVCVCVCALVNLFSGPEAMLDTLNSRKTH